MAAVFALAPAMAIVDALDFDNPSHVKLYIKGSQKLKLEHDGTSETLRPFLEEVQRRCIEFDCANLLEVAEADGIITRNIIDESRLVTLEDIREASTDYMGVESRDAQNNYMLQKCIMDSLTSEALIKLQHSEYDYKVDNAICAPLLIKALILMCEVENYATSFHVRDQMTRLKSKMIEVDYDIEMFNEHVIKLKIKLHQGGEESNDLFMHVMKAYLTCKDRDFLAEIKDLQRKYIRGDLPRNLSDLMLAGKNEYQRLIQDKTYNQPSPEETQLIALTAKLEQETEARASLEKKYRDFKARQDSGKADQRGGNPGSATGKQGRKVEAWMLKAPTDGKLTMNRNGVEWTWCPAHKKWGKHTEQQCRLKEKQGRSRSNEGDTTSGETSMAAAIAAILEEDDEDEDR